MKWFMPRPYLLAIALLAFLFTAAPALGWESQLPPTDTSLHGYRPQCPPKGCGTPPIVVNPYRPYRGNKFLWEISGRAWYSINSGKYMFDDANPDIDIIDDLNFSENAVFGELYAAMQVSPRFVLSYTVVFPREDHGHGVIRSPLDIGGTSIPANSPLTLQVTPFLARQDIEWYVLVGHHYRAGLLLTAEALGGVVRGEYRDAAGVLQDINETVVATINPGIGGTFEITPMPAVYAKVKAGGLIIPDRVTGLNFDAELKYFPGAGDAGCGSASAGLPGLPGLPPPPPLPFLPKSTQGYIGVGYHYKSLKVKIDDIRSVQGVVHGPTAFVGLVF